MVYNLSKTDCRTRRSDRSRGWRNHPPAIRRTVKGLLGYKKGILTVACRRWPPARRRSEMDAVVRLFSWLTFVSFDHASLRGATAQRRQCFLSGSVRVFREVKFQPLSISQLQRKKQRAKDVRPWPTRSLCGPDNWLSEQKSNAGEQRADAAVC